MVRTCTLPQAIGHVVHWPIDTDSNYRNRGGKKNGER